jgi:hypothetical protein
MFQDLTMLRQDPIICEFCEYGNGSPVSGPMCWPPRTLFAQDGSQPIESSFVGGANSGRPIRSQVEIWPVAFRHALIQFSGKGIKPGDLPRAAR